MAVAARTARTAAKATSLRTPEGRHHHEWPAFAACGPPAATPWPALDRGLRTDLWRPELRCPGLPDHG
jgi:hypothetical protein